MAFGIALGLKPQAIFWGLLRQIIASTARNAREIRMENIILTRRNL
jgi:hypothetical protein